MFGDGCTQDQIDDCGGLISLAWNCITTGCICEPCTLCEAGTVHEVGHGCLDYICLRCDAMDWLTVSGAKIPEAEVLRVMSLRGLQDLVNRYAVPETGHAQG